MHVVGPESVELHAERRSRVRDAALTALVTAAAALLWLVLVACLAGGVLLAVHELRPRPGDTVTDPLGRECLRSHLDPDGLCP